MTEAVSTPAASLDLPLAGIRVLDLATGAIGAIGRQLAELGAEVIRIEPPGGAADRREGRSVAGVSIGFAAANLGKRAIALDLTVADDKAAFERLLANADLLIESTEPGSTAAAELDVAGIRRRHPKLVLMSVTPFGLEGRFRNWQATDPVLHALSGELSRSGLKGRPPLLPPGTLAVDCAIPQAVFALLLAFYNRLRTGEGDHLDLSLLDAASQALDPGYGISGSAAMGVPASKLPRGRENATARYPIIACADGYTRICMLAPRQWQGMFEWMGRPEEFADPSYNSLMNRFRSKTLIPAIGKLFANKTRAELEAEGQKFGVPTAAVLSPREAMESPQMKARGATRPVALGAGIDAPFPDGVMEIDGTRAGIRGPVPALESAAPADTQPRLVDGIEAPAAGERPLSGLRVLDLGVIVVGAEQSRLLGDQGAEVYKVETSAFPDGSRQTIDGANMSPSLASGHRNKLGLGLNLRDPQGKALFLELAKTADVVFSNFKPGTMESLGLGYDALSAVNPGIVVIDSSAFGPTGPWAKRLGYGPLVRASTGLTAQWCYPDDELGYSDAITVYPDHVAGRTSAIGALALLIRRLRTGRGGRVSISQAEVMLGHMAPQAAEAALSAAGHALEGPAQQDAPWGVYACDGDDEWCVVSVRGDADFKALCEVIGAHDLLADARLSTAAGRVAERDRIDAIVGDWLRTRSPRVAAEALQAAGVPAAPMLRVIELPDFDYFRERGIFKLVQHPRLAEAFHVESWPVKSTRLPEPPNEPAPLIGEHSRQILRERLGMSEEAIDALVEAKVIEVAAS